LRLVGLAATTEWLIAILRWPVLLATIVVSLACIYRYGPSRKDARWRWVTWGRGSTAVNRFLFCGPQGYPLRKQQPRPNAKPIGSEPMRSPRHRPRRGRDGRTLVPSRRRARLAAWSILWNCFRSCGIGWKCRWPRHWNWSGWPLMLIRCRV